METLIGLITLVFVQLGIFIYGYGKLSQKVNDAAKNNHAILPECQKTFQEISKSLGNLDGKVDMLIQSNHEKLQH